MNNNDFNSISDFFNKWKGRSKTRSKIISLIITIVIGFLLEYLLLVPINLFCLPFLSFIVFLLVLYNVIYFALSLDFKRNSFGPLVIAALILVFMLASSLFGSPIFNADKYHNQLNMIEDADFTTDIEQINYDNIPLVDSETAALLGDRKLGSIMDYVSQFDIYANYTQINVNNHPYRVTPIVYSDMIKWFNNKDDGLPCYIKVDMVSQEAEVVRLQQGMMYSTSDMFGRNIHRHLRFNYWDLMFDEVTFEINDEGVPYWVASVYEYEIGLFNGKDIVGAVLVNAIDGSHQYYDIADIPTWVDRVMSSDIALAQLNNWGRYTNGYWNTVFGQKGVLQTTEGYSYLAIDDDVYLYTGLTSVLADESNVGFALINLRTKQAKFYNVPGAEEFSAMSSAEGQVQHLGYVATFPTLINVAGEPTYFMSLKDNAGLVKKYAFVSVDNYQQVGVGDSVMLAQTEYINVLSGAGKANPSYNLVPVSGIVSDIATAVKDGNSLYYFTLTGSDIVYIAPLSLNSKLPLLRVGSNVSLEHSGAMTDSVVIIKIEIE